MERRELRAQRCKNAKLMASNLSMLMAVREAEADVVVLLDALSDQCAALERAGVAVPATCQALLQPESAAMGEANAPEGNSAAVGAQRQGSAPSVGVETTDES